MDTQPPGKSGIYKIVNQIDGKIYVGSAKDFTNRWYRHRRHLSKNSHPNRHLQNAWNCYGEEQFKFEIICRCPPSCLLGMEQFYLNKYFDNCVNCYNILPLAGSTLGYKHSETTKSKIALSEGGKLVSKETKLLLSQNHADVSGERHPLFGKQRSKETKKKMAAASKGNKNMLGKHHSEQTKLTISEAKKNISEETRRRMSDARKKYYTLKNGKVEHEK